MSVQARSGAVLTALDGPGLRAWCEGGLAGLRRARVEIDDLNVYPVPDGDTGTNLVLTMVSVTDALRAAAADGVTGLGATAAVMARAALMGARGNSGVILSQLLRGLADTWGERGACAGEDLAAALRRAERACWAAVEAPVEGTVLSVARAAADAAEAGLPGTLHEVAVAAAEGAARALAETPRQLAVLARAGVVDAGGRGLVVLLDALAALVGGHDAGGSGPTDETVPADPPDTADPPDIADTADTAAHGSRPGYEVQYLLEADAVAVDVLRSALAPLGDSLVVVGADDLWNVHVHVDDVGAAIEAGVVAGRPHRIAVTRFADQLGPRPGRGGGCGGTERTGRAVVAVAPGEGLAELFAAEGATVVSGGSTANPSTAMILTAVLATGAAEVVVLPNDSAAQPVAVAAATRAREEHGVAVSVLPTRSSLQGLAALAVADPGARFDDAVVAMSAAAAATRWAEVTVAVRAAQTTAGVCAAGDVLGLLEGDVVLIVGPGPDAVAEAARTLLDRMLGGGGELVTVVTGRDLPAGVGQELSAWLATAHPTVDTVVYAGQQPHHPVLLAVE